MSDVKQVKVDNWGIYFLQRLKHFFNRTDYCDLTLQFQDNAQLKVHRLVLNACTEYFELLERTCEMYEDCLVMPDDLQADVVVPIVNFMYTGHLEFRMDLLERLYQTSQILNMPVLSKLLESHRNVPKTGPSHSYSAVKKFSRQSESKPVKLSIPSTSHKRSYNKAFESNSVYKDKKAHPLISKPESVNNSSYRAPSPVPVDPLVSQKSVLSDPRPTRYEIPEELDTDNVFDNSFCSISYTSQPLMVHPDTVKRYSAKRTGLFSGASSSKKASGVSTVDIVECKRITKEDQLFDDGIPEHNLNDETDMFSATYMDTGKDTNQLFDQMLDHNDGPKVTIETKDSKAASNLDHARIISEVLKKYPHLVKSNKSIKLKILDPTPSKGKTHRQQKPSPTYVDEKPLKLKAELESDYTYETDVLDSKQAAKLIALGAENIKGPWICLICGTPGKALHFPSYFKFRRHLVDVHNEKPVSNICEYCGLKSLKRNYLMHHLYAQHGIQPPPQYNFPKCNLCNYIALTEGLLVKHKMTHKDVRYFRCNVCSSAFVSSKQLLTHIQNTGHKYSSEKKSNNLQCIYCLKVFLREANLYAHIKTHHKKEAKNDCIIEDSDDEKIEIEIPRAKGPQSIIKYEPSTSYDNDFGEIDIQYQIQQRPIDRDIQAVSRKPHHVISNSKQKILNPGFDAPKPAQKAKITKTNQIRKPTIHNDFYQEIKMPVINQDDEIVVIDNNEYIMRDNQLIPRKRKSSSRDFIIPDMVEPASIQTIEQPSTSVQYTTIQNKNIEENLHQQHSMIIKKSANINQPIQIVVSNEEEYKALMASNHPIIFDNGDTNKTLTVLTAQHHNSTMDTTGIDLNNTQTNDMMIIPNEYPLNVSEPVSTENSNIVVVYSHPVDDQNKQFQILTTGGLGAQFVQSSAIITQNYETVTTSTPVMTAHCIEAQVEQPWQNNIQSINQQIQLASERVVQTISEPDHVEIKLVHNETGNIDELPEVNLVPEPHNILPPEVCVSDTDNIQNQSDITENIRHLAQPDEQTIVEEHQNIPEAYIDVNATSESVIVKETPTTIDPVDAHPESESIPDILSNIDNINIISETIESQNVIEQPIETENIITQPMETENIVEQPELPMETENIIEPPEQPMETESEIEQCIPALQKEAIPEQDHTTDAIATTEDLVAENEDLETEDQQVTENEDPEMEDHQITENEDLETEDQQPEPMVSQAYDDIVKINNEEPIEPVYAKADEKIQNLTSEWSEDEYDVVKENPTAIIVNLHNEIPQNQVLDEEPELEESIENIQQEMKKQMIASQEGNVEIEESVSSSIQGDDTSSQEMQLPPLLDSPIHTVVQNPQAQQKISSLLNDWEENDSQEEMITVETTSDETNVDTPQLTEDVTPIEVPKNDNIKSLVSDWDDDEEENKE